MKKLTTLILTAITMIAVVSCKKNDDKPTPEETPVTGAIELSGNLSTQTLKKKKKYVLKGQVFVNDGQVLTIPAGTVIMGDTATQGLLVVNRGG